MLGVGISTQRLHTIILFSILTLVWTVISFISMQVIVRNSILDIAIDRLNEDIKKTQAYIKAIEQIDNETEPTITKKENK
jgi:4-hydroxybenzoate polyprenyltransferase